MQLRPLRTDWIGVGFTLATAAAAALHAPAVVWMVCLVLALIFIVVGLIWRRRVGEPPPRIVNMGDRANVNQGDQTNTNTESQTGIQNSGSIDTGGGSVVTHVYGPGAVVPPHPPPPPLLELHHLERRMVCPARDHGFNGVQGKVAVHHDVLALRNVAPSGDANTTALNTVASVDILDGTGASVRLTHGFWVELGWPEGTEFHEVMQGWDERPTPLATFPPDGTVRHLAIIANGVFEPGDGTFQPFNVMPTRGTQHRTLLDPGLRPGDYRVVVTLRAGNMAPRELHFRLSIPRDEDRDPNDQPAPHLLTVDSARAPAPSS